MDLIREVSRLHGEVLKMPASVAASKITSDLEQAFNAVLDAAKGQCPGAPAIHYLEPVSGSICLIELASRLQILLDELSKS